MQLCHADLQNGTDNKITKLLEVSSVSISKVKSAHTEKQ